MKLASSTKALAAELGCTRRTISAWLKRPDSPGRTATGGFNISRWQKWISENGLGTRTSSADRDPRLQALKNEKMRLQSEKIALETVAVAIQNRVARGELVRMDDAKRVVGDAWGAMLRQLRQTKHRISAQVCGLDSGTASRLLADDLAQTMRQFSIPEGLARHPYFGPLRAQIEELHDVLQEDGL